MRYSLTQGRYCYCLQAVDRMHKKTIKKAPCATGPMRCLSIQLNGTRDGRRLFLGNIHNFTSFQSADHSPGFSVDLGLSKC